MGELALKGGPPVHAGPWPSWPRVGDGDIERVGDVLRSGRWGIGGAAIDEFQERFADFCDARHCVCTTSGTSALILALRALGVGPGDEVILPPFTFIASAASILEAGAVPVFADIGADTLLLDPRAAEGAVTDRTRAIMPVHIGGAPCDMDAINAVAERHALLVVEDAAQAHGAMYRGRKVGAIGSVGAFSFQSSKNLNCGEGGAVCTNDDEVAERAWSLHNVGREPPEARFEHTHIGYNMRMTQLQAGLLLSQIEGLEEQMATRDANAARLRERLRAVDGVEPVKLAPGAERSAYHLFPMIYDADAFDGLPRDAFLQALRAEGIPISAGYGPLYRYIAGRPGARAEECPLACALYARRMDYATVRLPVAEEMCPRTMWLGQTVLLATAADTDSIADAMVKVHRHREQLLTLRR